MQETNHSYLLLIPEFHFWPAEVQIQTIKYMTNHKQPASAIFAIPQFWGIFLWPSHVYALQQFFHWNPSFFLDLVFFLLLPSDWFKSRQCSMKKAVIPVVLFWTTFFLWSMNEVELKSQVLFTLYTIFRAFSIDVFVCISLVRCMYSPATL